MVIIHGRGGKVMNKLILLNEVREEKVKYRNKLLTVIEDDAEQQEYKNSYVTFKEKFNCLQNREGLFSLNNDNDAKAKSSVFEKKLIKIMERIFSLKNYMPLMELINSIYNDDFNETAKVNITKNREGSKSEVIILKDSNYNLKVSAEDEYKKIEYKIQFQAKDEQNIGIIISKVDLSDDNNVISLNKKRKEYVNENNLKEDSTKYLIMLNSSIEVPDEYEFRDDCEGENVACKVNIIKGWKYDFKQLFESSMYLLIPMKVIDFIKISSGLNRELISKEQIKDEMIRLYKDINKYLSKAKNKAVLNDKDINELNILAVDLLNLFIIDKKDNLLFEINREIQVVLKEIVV